MKKLATIFVGIMIAILLWWLLSGYVTETSTPVDGGFEDIGVYIESSIGGVILTFTETGQYHVIYTVNPLTDQIIVDDIFLNIDQVGSTYFIDTQGYEDYLHHEITVEKDGDSITYPVG